MSEGPQSDGPLSGPLGSAGLRAARRFLPAQNGLNGTITVPGDKSVSHRAILFGAVNDGPLRVSGFLHSADTMATLAAARALGVEVDEDGGDLLIHASGWEGLREPADVIDVRNAGTLIRLLPGLVAPLPFLSFSPWPPWAPKSPVVTTTRCRRSPSEGARYGACATSWRWPRPR